MLASRVSSSIPRKIFVDCSKTGITQIETPLKDRRRAPRTKFPYRSGPAASTLGGSKKLARLRMCPEKSCMLYFETSARHYIEQYFHNRKFPDSRRKAYVSK